MGSTAAGPNSRPGFPLRDWAGRAAAERIASLWGVAVLQGLAVRVPPPKPPWELVHTAVRTEIRAIASNGGAGVCGPRPDLVWCASYSGRSHAAVMAAESAEESFVVLLVAVAVMDVPNAAS